MKKRYLVGAALVVVALSAGAIWRAHTTKKPVATPAPSQGRYVALGDSVAAGIGLKDYSDSSACDRTKQSYPEQLAAKRHYTLTSVACSGATTTQGLLGSQDVNQLAVPAQLTTALTGERPRLVTITFGANDAQWTTLLQKCYTAVCGSAADTAIVKTGLATAGHSLDEALKNIQTTYATQTPDVLITGYYRLFGAGPQADCPELRGVDAAEQAWISQLQTDVDATLRTAAAKYSFAAFVPLDFTGHELCTDTPWVQELGAQQPYHPTEAGQTAIANQLLTALDAKRKTP